MKKIIFIVSIILIILSILFLKIKLNKNPSSNFSFTTAVYDIELIESNVTTRLLQGKIKLSKEVTWL